MSGYRTIHREQLHDGATKKQKAIWSVHVTRIHPTSTEECWRLWTGFSDGSVRVYTILEKRNIDDVLDASALGFRCTHKLVGSDDETHVLGCTRVGTVRNYVGDDPTAGDLVVATLDLGGIVRIWSFPNEWERKQYDDAPEGDDLKSIKSLHSFTVENATGTTGVLAPPRVMQGKEAVVIAVGCLDGTVALLSTGISTPVAKKEAPPAGTVLHTWGTSGSSIPLTLSWNPVETETLVVARQNGAMDILRPKKNYRLTQLAGSPVRAASYTPDAHLLVAGNDAGLLCVWDTQRPSGPVLVHHVAQAHTGSWIVDVQCLHDSRRFVTVGADKKLHVWNVGQLAAGPLHTLHLDSPTWALHHLLGETRMVAGSESGSMFVFSLEV